MRWGCAPAQAGGGGWSSPLGARETDLAASPTTAGWGCAGNIAPRGLPVGNMSTRELTGPFR